MALPIAYLRKLETALDPKIKQGQVFQLTAPANEAGCVDFGSNNTLSLGGSKAIRDEFFRELARNPNFEIGTGSSRVLGGAPLDMQANSNGTWPSTTMRMTG